MCGIVGAWSLEGPLDPNALGPESLEALRHRGPDGDGWYADERCILGFRRLAIIDVAGGAQPMRSERGDVRMTLNGEIYNHDGLRLELAQDHRFRSRSDAEVVLHGYEAWGLDVFRRLRGMFAVALADRRRERLVLARDRVGKKPLYYTVRDGVLRWASEIAPLLPAGRRPPIDPVALNDYLRFGYVPAPRTLLEGVRKVPAGCLLVTGANGQVEIRRWSPLLTRAPFPRGEDEAGWANAVRGALADAVETRMESEVPLGFLLSGGIDSASVFALGAQALGGPAHAFTVGFDEADVDETAAAVEVASRYGARHTVRTLLRDEAPDLGQVIARCEEPLATDALLPTDRIFAAVKQAGITTILAGEGADEIFAGYRKFTLASAPDGGEAWRRAGTTPLSRYLSTEEFCFAELEERRALVGDVATNDGYAWLDEAVEHLDPLSQMLSMEVALRLPDRINLRLDRLSMAHGIEARAPFMDRALMELALQVPHVLRTRPEHVKWILRRALQGDVPDRVVHARKAPFRAPDRWFVDGDVLSPDRVRDAGLVREEAVAPLRAAAATDAGARERLYNLTVLHLWHRDWYTAAAA